MIKKSMLIYVLLILSSCSFINSNSSEHNSEDSFSFESISSSDESYESIEDLIDLSKEFDKIISNTDFDNVSSDILLSSEIEGLVITCVSDNPEVLSNDGKVFITEEDKLVNFTITLSYGEQTFSKDVLVTVKATKINESSIYCVLENKDLNDYYKLQGTITGKNKKDLYYLSDGSGSILINCNKELAVGDEITLIGNLLIEDDNYIFSNTNNINIISSANVNDQVYMVDSFLSDEYLYKQVSIENLKVTSIDYSEDIIFEVSKGDLITNIYIDSEIDECIYNAFMSLKDEINVGDILDVNNAHVIYYDGNLSLNVSDIYSVKKENNEEVLGFGKRHTYGISPKDYYCNKIDDLENAIIESYFSNYSGFTVKFDCLDNPISFDQIMYGTHMYTLVDHYTYYYYGDHFDVITNQTITFEFIDFQEDTASLYVDKTQKNTYEELTNASLYIKERYILNSEYKRNENYNDFSIYLNNKGYLNVRNSQELWLALEYGYLPNFVYDNSAAETYFNQAKDILRKIITNDMCDFEKIKAIYDYISYNSSYDYDALSVNYRTAYGCQYLDGFFKEGRVVCDGFAKLFTMLCAIEGIEAVYTFAQPNNNNAGHAWNYVNIDGNWYTICTTFSQLRADSADSLGKFYDYTKIQWISYEPFMAHHTYMNVDYPNEYMWNNIKNSQALYIYNPLKYETSYDYVINNQEELNDLFEMIKNKGLTNKYYVTFNTENFEINIEDIGKALSSNEIYGTYMLYTENVYDTVYYTVFIN